MRFLLHVFFSFTILLLDKYSLTTDATVRSVTIEFKFGQKVEETTVGKDVLLNLFSIFFHFSLDLRTVSSVFTFDDENNCLILTSTDK